MECLHVMALHKILEQPWWAYITVSMGFFVVCLALNYAVKKLNEARMGDRLVRVLEKSSVPQSTHVNGPVITLPSEGEPRTISVKAPQLYSPPAISLIFDKEENKRIGDVYNMVKPLTDWTYGDLSINSEKSLETDDVLPTSSDRTVGESSPIKKIECELVTAKATSHTFSEKVLIKDKIDSYDLITPKKYSYSEIPGIAGCNTNSVTAKESGSIIIRRTSSNEPKKTVTENNSFSNISAGRMVPTKNYIVENAVKNTNVIKDKKSKEKIDTGCLDNIMSKIANLKNRDDNPRIEKSATNTIIAKSSSSHSGSIWRETKITSIEKKESSCIAAKESSHTHYNRGGENIPVKTSKSEQIVSKETSCDAQNESDVRETYVPIRNNVIMNSSSNERSHYNVAESVSFKNTECGPVLDKIDSADLPDLVTVKNQRFEQIPGILPFTGKDLYTSKLISKKKTDILATEERAARKASESTLDEGTTSNDPTNSVGENIPFKNIGAGRMFPTNISFTEIVVKDPKVIRDKKSNEEIDTSCLDGHTPKIAILKNMNDDTRLEKSATLSNRNVTKIRSVEKTESKEILPDSQFKRFVREYATIARNSVKNEFRLIELKKTSSYEPSSSNVTENVPIKTSEPGRIVAKQTALLTRSDTNAAGRIVAEATPSHTQSPIRTSEFVFLAAEGTSNRQSDDNVPGTNIATSPNTQNEITVSKDGSIKKTESGSINVKETSNRQTEINVPDTDIIQMYKTSCDAVEEKSLRKLVLASYPKYFTIQQSGSGSIAARETASCTLSGSDLLNSIKMSESGSIAAKEICTKQSEASAVKKESLRELVSADNATKYVTIQPSGSGSIVARETAPRILSGSDLNSIKMSESGSIVAKEIYNRQSEASAVKEERLRELVSANNTTKHVTIQTSGSGSIVARETAPRILSGSDLLNSIKMSESGSIAAKEIYNRQSEASAVKKESLRELVSANNATKHVTTQTSGSGSIVARETAPRTLSGSDLLNSIKRSESGSIVAKEIYNRQSEASAVKKERLREPVSADNATIYVTIQTSGSGSIVTRETDPRTLSGSDFLNSIKMSESGSIAAKEIYNRQSEASAVKKESLRELVSANNATKYITIQPSGSGITVARDAAPLTLSGLDVLNPLKIKMSESGSIVLKEISKTQSEDNLPDTNVVEMDGSGPDPDTAGEEETMRVVLAKDNEDIESGNLKKTDR